MNYKIQIVKIEPNTNFEAELKEFEERSRYSRNYNDSLPTRDIVKNILSVELTEEQYKKVKSEVFKVFE